MRPWVRRSPSYARCGPCSPTTCHGRDGGRRERMHPGAMSEPTKVSPSSRYQVIHQTTRGLARREPTFALHVHVGVPDPQRAIRLVNQLRAHLPLLLALSASSPLYRGRRTGWPQTARSCSRGSRAPGSPAASITTGTGSRPSTCSCGREQSPSRRSCGGTCVRSRGWERSRCGSWTPSPGWRRRRRWSRGAVARPARARAGLCLAEACRRPGGAGRESLYRGARRYCGRADRPRDAVMVPLPQLLADVLAAARPHAAALDAVEELDDVRMLVLAPEARRQEDSRRPAACPRWSPTWRRASRPEAAVTCRRPAPGPRAGPRPRARTARACAPADRARRSSR